MSLLRSGSVFTVIWRRSNVYRYTSTAKLLSQHVSVTFSHHPSSSCTNRGMSSIVRTAASHGSSTLPNPSSVPISGRPQSPLGEALGDLHRRSWKASHVNDLAKKCGTDRKKWWGALTTLAKEGKSLYLRAALDRMALVGVRVDGVHIRLLMDSCLVSKNFTLAYEYLERFSAHSHVIPALYLRALIVCGKLGDAATADRLMKLMSLRGQEPGAEAEAAHMHAYAASGDLAGALSVLASSSSSSPAQPPSSESLLSSPQSAHAAIISLLQQPHISLSSFNTLLTGCCHSADLASAHLILEQMGARGLRPSSRAWSSIVQTAVMAGRPEEGLELLREMLQDGGAVEDRCLAPHSFNHLLASFSKEGDTSNFKEVFSLLTTFASMDHYSYSILFASVSNGVLLQESSVVETLSSAPPPSAPPCADKSARQPYEATMEVVMSHMLQSGLVPSNHSWRVASAPYCQALNYTGLEKLVALIDSFYLQQQRGQGRGAEQWRLLRLAVLRDSLGCLGRLGRAEEAFSLLKSSSAAEGWREDRQNCWLRVVRAYAEGRGDWRGAVRVLDYLRDRGVSLTPLLWRYPLQRCAASESLHALVELLREGYQKDGLLPDEKGWGLVVAAVSEGARSREGDAPASPGAITDMNDKPTLRFEQEALILQKFISACPQPVRKYIVASLARYLDSHSDCSPEDVQSFLSSYRRLFSDVKGGDKVGKGLLSAAKRVGTGPRELPEWNLSDIIACPVKPTKKEESPSEVPSNVHFLARMKAAAFENDVNGCFVVYDDMRNFLTHHSLHGQNPCGGEIITGDFFDALLSMSVKHHHREEEAEAIFRSMIDMRVSPSRVTYRYTLRALACSGNTAAAISVAEHCLGHRQFGKGWEWSPAVESVHAKVIHKISESGGRAGSAAAIEYIEGLFRLGVKTSRLFAALITEHLKMDDVAGALRVVDGLLEDSDIRLLEVTRFIDIAYMSLLNCIIKSDMAFYEKGRVVDRFIRSLVQRQIKTLATFSLYTDYLIKDRNDIYVYIDLLNEMSVLFGQEACTIWENLLQKCAQEGMHEEAVWTLDRMYESPTAPTFECLGLVARALCAGGNHQEAWEMLQRMGLEHHALHPDEPHAEAGNDHRLTPARELSCRHWHPLVDALQSSGQHRRLKEVVASMREVHVTPDKHCSLSAMLACLAMGEQAEAMQVAEDLQPADEDIYRQLLLHLAATDLPLEVAVVLERVDQAGIRMDNEVWAGVEGMRRHDVVLEALEKRRGMRT